MQTKRLAMLEVATNTLTGLIGSWLITLHFVSGVLTPIETASLITAACTVWSLLRGYVIRRIFNHLSVKSCQNDVLNKLYAENVQFHKDMEQWDTAPKLTIEKIERQK